MSSVDVTNNIHVCREVYWILADVRTDICALYDYSLLASRGKKYFGFFFFK